MNISEFSLRNLSFELRYAPAYRLWDHSGEIWSNAAKQWPDLTHSAVNASHMKFTIGRRAELTLQLDRFNITLVGVNPALEEFSSYCTFLADQVVSILGVAKYTRVGFRPVFAKEFPSEEEATEALLSTGFVKRISGKHFGFEGKTVGPNAATRFESETLGCTINLRVQTRTLTVEVPIGEEDPFEGKTSQHFELCGDFDYYTKTDVLIGQLNPAEWIKQALHVIRRDAAVVFGA